MVVIVHIPEGIPLYILVQVQGAGISVVYVKALVLGQEASTYPIILHKKLNLSDEQRKVIM